MPRQRLSSQKKNQPMQRVDSFLFALIMIGVFLIVIFLEAFYETQYDKGNKTFSGGIESVFLFILIGALCFLEAPPILYPVSYHGAILLFIGYILIRYAVFSSLWGLMMGKGPFFIGNTKLFDKFLHNFFGWTRFPIGHFLAWTKLLSLILGAYFVFESVHPWFIWVNFTG